MIQGHELSLHDISHHYDELDTFYRKLWGTHLHHGLWDSPRDTKEQAVLNLSHRVLNEMGEIQGKELVDIGCGYGGTTRLASEKGAGKVTGMTLSKKQFDFAHQAEAPGTEYVHGDWLHNHFSDQQFDGGFSIECFSHIQNKKRYFDEIKRTLKPGSPFVMTAWLSCNNPSRFGQTFILKPICHEGRLPSLLTAKELLILARDAGLTFIKETDLSRKVWRTWLTSAQEVLKLLFTQEGFRYFMSSDMKERMFALSVLRILIGYQTGAFRYGLFVLKT
jgi:tocopherol O-methyltransferase